MAFEYDSAYKELPENIERAKKVLRNLGGVANLGDFLGAMVSKGIAPPAALLAAESTEEINVDHLKTTVSLTSKLVPKKESAEDQLTK